MSEFRRRLMMAAGEKELPNYLCFTALESGTFSFTIRSNITTANLSYIEYSVDGGNSWTKTNNIQSTEVVITTPSVSTGDKVYWRGSGTTLGTANSNNKWCTFSSTGEFDAEGCVASLLNPSDFENLAVSSNYGLVRLFYNSLIVDASLLVLPSFSGTYMFYEMFYGCVHMTAIPSLGSTTLTDNCYRNMFYGCTSLQTAPQLPATSLVANCYNGMFYGCSALATVPDINISSITGAYVMQSMFYNCISLIHCPIKSFPSTIGEGCLAEAFRGCSNLVDICELPASILASFSYRQLLRDTKVSYIKMLATNISATNCISNWVIGVPSSGIFVKHIDATWTTTGNSGVPTNWTVIYYDPALDKYYTDQTRATECDDHGNPI